MALTWEDRTLLKAVKNREYNTVQGLLAQKKGNINAHDLAHEAAIFVALMNNDHYMLTLVIDDGRANLAIRNRQGDTPIIFIIKERKDNLLSMLLQRGASPNEVNQAGQTPLMVATEMGQFDSVKLLVQYGAEILVAGKYLLTIAEKHQHEEIAAFFRTQQTTLGSFAPIEEAEKGQTSVGTDETFASAYSEATALGMSPKEASVYATHYNAEVAVQGRPVLYAKAQALKQVTVSGTNIEPNEESIQEAIFSKMLKDKGPEFTTKYRDSYDSQRASGKTHNWAHAFASQIARNKKPPYATKFAQQRIQGKSFDWSKAYASAVERGEDSVLAAQVADLYDNKRKLGAPKNWAWKYAFHRIKKGKTHDEAVAYADKKAGKWQPLEEPIFRQAEYTV